jgi:ferredoxin
VVEITDAKQQKDAVGGPQGGPEHHDVDEGRRQAGSFIEDCAVPLEHLAEYTDRLTRVFEKHGTRGTWYAHASVGTLHVRPVLDMRRDGAEKMRAIAEEACALVQAVQGRVLGRARRRPGALRMDRAVLRPAPHRGAGEIKSWLDPRGLMNPGRSSIPRRWTTAACSASSRATNARAAASARLEEWGGFDKAVEMCNNNGHCRKFDAGTMCPSYRATMDEVHLTRGRANTLRLALVESDSASIDAKDALDLCVSCKGCKRECPTGVDMARMKVEFTAQYKARHGYTARDRAIAYLPRYAPWAARMAPLANAASGWARGALGFTTDRELPRWRRDASPIPARPAADVVLFVDTFNRYFEPENARAAMAVLRAAGIRCMRPRACAADAPFLSAGMVDEAKREAGRLLRALAPYAERGVPIVGLEPSCLFSLARRAHRAAAGHRDGRQAGASFRGIPGAASG